MQVNIVFCVLIMLLFCCISTNAQSRREVWDEINKQNVPHAKIVYAQARLESGNFSSDFYKKTKNLFGIKRKGKYVRYKDWRESIRDYKKTISTRYKGGSYYDFIVRIGYAKDKDYVSKVKRIAQEKI